MAETVKVSMNLEKDMWTKFRIRCLQEHKTATEVVEKLIADHMKKTATKQT